MQYDPERHHRRSIRLKGYNYTWTGAYFVTLCTRGRVCLFGEIVVDAMRLNAYGEIVQEEWFRSAEIRREIALFSDEFIVMPNHIHGIVRIVESPDTHVEATCPTVGATGRSPLRGPAKRSLASFVAGFKSAATKRINEHRGTPGATIWQRNYYEHIIRHGESLNRIRAYILNNPLQWHSDHEHAPATGALSWADE